jgi:hypothetical protein
LEGIDPTDAKDRIGIFNEDGLPPGNCTVLAGAVSNEDDLRW